MERLLQSPMAPPSARKKAAVADFTRHVSPGKAAFYKGFGMDFVMGRRSGGVLYDIDADVGGADGDDEAAPLPEAVSPDKFGLYNLHCNGGVFNLGHRHPAMVDAVCTALRDDGLDIGNHHLVSEARAELGRALAEALPGDLSVTIFGVSGGEAVDLALKMAFGHTGRGVVVVAEGAYHGNTGLSVRTGDAKFLAPFGLPVAGEDPDFVRVPFGDEAALAAALDRDVAAVLMEAVPATLGMVTPPAGYFRAMRRLCDEVGALMIIDEVQTGMGRSGGGRLWAIEHYLDDGDCPDIMVLGKGLSGGVYPISATCFRPHLAELFLREPFAHVSTFGGSEVGCRVTARLLAATRERAFLAHVDALAAAWREGIAALRDAHPGFVKGLRQLGLFCGVELVDAAAGPVFTKAAFDQGVLLIYAANDPRVVQLLPPLNMPLAHVQPLCARLSRAVAAAERLHPLYKAKQAAEQMLPFLKRKPRPGSAAAKRPSGASQRTGAAAAGAPVALHACALLLAAAAVLVGGDGFVNALVDTLLAALSSAGRYVSASHALTGLTALMCYVVALAALLCASRLCSAGSHRRRAGRLSRLPAARFALSDAALREVEAQVGLALADGSTDSLTLPVLGYGEVSVVFAHDGEAQDDADEQQGDDASDTAAQRAPRRAGLRRRARKDDDGDADGDGGDGAAASPQRPPARTPLALKRLAALFDARHAAALDAYEHAIAAYVRALEAHGVACVPTALQRYERADGKVVAYLVQPRAPRERLLPVFLASAPRDVALTAFRALLGVIEGATGALGGRLGLDGQLANWLLDVDPGEVVAGDARTVKLRYLDNSTPFMKDRDGREMLDLSAFLVTFPAPLRVLVSTFLVKGIIQQYYSARLVIKDLIANMLKERLDGLVAPFIAEANARAAVAASPEGPITEAEVRSYYKSDAAMYAALQWARRADRWVTMRVCRRTYPHLLPPPIER